MREYIGEIHRNVNVGRPCHSVGMVRTSNVRRWPLLRLSSQPTFPAVMSTVGNPRDTTVPVVGRDSRSVESGMHAALG